MNLLPYVERLPEFLARPITQREALWSDARGQTVIPHPSVGMLYASRGAGKTLTALDLGLRVAAGSPWGPYLVGARVLENDARRVLFVDGEMPEADLQVRLGRLGRPFGAPALGRCYLLGSDRLAAARQEMNLGKARDREAVTAVVEEMSVDFLVLDNWVSLLRGLDENDNAAIGPVAQWLARLRHDGTSVLVVHHAGKEGKQRGASAREDILDYSLRLMPLAEGSGEGVGASWRLSWDKTRGGVPEPRSFVLELLENGELTARRSSRAVVLESLRDGGPGTAAEVAERLGVGVRRVERALEGLAREGLARPAGEVQTRGRPRRVWEAGTNGR